MGERFWGVFFQNFLNIFLNAKKAAYYKFKSQVLEKKLAQLTEGDEKVFRLLLSHRPELFPIYQKSGVDMVLCGHAHGGQFRLLHQGVFAPGQGVLPKYTGGVHVQGATAMVVSRGLGNSEFPLRLNNRPEIVKLILSHEE